MLPTHHSLIPHHLTLQHFQEALSSTQIHRWTPQPLNCHTCVWLTAVCRLDLCGGLFAGAPASALSPAAYAQHSSQGSCWNVTLQQVIPLLRNISQASHLTQGQAEGIPMEPALPDSAPNYSSKATSTLLHPLTLFLPHRPLCWPPLRAFAFALPSAWNGLPPRRTSGWLPYSLQPLPQPRLLCEGFPYLVLLFSRSVMSLCNPMDCSMPGFPVLHCLPEFAQTHVHWVGDAIQPSHSLTESP